MPIIADLAKSTRHMSQAAFYSIKSPHYRKHGAHSRVVTVLRFGCTNIQRSSSDLLPWVSGGVASREDSSHSGCQLLRKTIHNVPQYPKSCPVSCFLSGLASWLIAPTGPLRTVTSGSNNGLHSDQETFPQLLICPEIVGLYSVRITYMAEHSP
jgi:hypothetical protein